jgi:hypothetical protein
MVSSHRYPLLAKSTQPPIPYWTQKIIAQAPNKIADFFRLLYHSMLATPLAFDCSANEMSSALLESPSFVANITVARRGPSLEGAYSWYLAIVSDVSMESTLSPLECNGQDLKGVGAAVYVTEINPHSLNFGLLMSFPSWYGSAYLLIQVSVASGSLDRSTSTFKSLRIVHHRFVGESFFTLQILRFPHRSQWSLSTKMPPWFLETNKCFWISTTLPEGRRPSSTYPIAL